MAQELGTERNGSGIAHERKGKWGYDAAQVDTFLERAHSLYDSDEVELTQEDIQNASFDLRKGGYSIVQVDSALTRLERAVVDKQTAREITDQGRVGWKAETEVLYRQIADHAKRDEAERFKSGRAKYPSYDRKQVDQLVDQVVEVAGAELVAGNDSKNRTSDPADINAAAVSNVIFTQRTGKRGYDERQVDYFLSVCVQLLSRLESYARVSDYVTSPDNNATVITSPRYNSSGDVRPLFSEAGQYTPVDARASESPRSYAPAATTSAVGSTGEAPSFDVPTQIERDVFNAPSIAPLAATPQSGAVTGEPALPVAGTPDEPTSTNSSLAALAHLAAVSPEPDAAQQGTSNFDSYAHVAPWGSEGSSSDRRMAADSQATTNVFGQPPTTEPKSYDSRNSGQPLADTQWTSSPGQSPTEQSGASQSQITQNNFGWNTLQDQRQPTVQSAARPGAESEGLPASFAPGAKPQRRRHAAQDVINFGQGVESGGQSTSGQAAPAPRDAIDFGRGGQPEGLVMPRPATPAQEEAPSAGAPPSFDGNTRRGAPADLFGSDSAKPAALTDAQNGGAGRDDRLFSDMFPESESESSINLDIPDLSFPVLDQNATARKNGAGASLEGKANGGGDTRRNA